MCGGAERAGGGGHRGTFLAYLRTFAAGHVGSQAQPLAGLRYPVYSHFF